MGDPNTPSTAEATSNPEADSADESQDQVLRDRHRFTWTDLQRINGSLKLASDSTWLPVPLRDNLFTTIRFALDPINSADGRPPADEISVKDFYHAHVVVRPEDPAPNALVQSSLDFIRGLEAEQTRSTMTEVSGMPRWDPESFPLGTATPADRAAIRAVNTRLHATFRDLVKKAISDAPRNAVVSYHTRERRPKSIVAEWTHRNLILPLFPRDENPPAPGDLQRRCIDDPRERALRPEFVLMDGSPPAPRTPQTGVEASNWPILMNFAFLIASDGNVFVRANGPSLVALEFTTR